MQKRSRPPRRRQKEINNRIVIWRENQHLLHSWIFRRATKETRNKSFLLLRRFDNANLFREFYVKVIDRSSIKVIDISSSSARTFRQLVNQEFAIANSQLQIYCGIWNLESKSPQNDNVVTRSESGIWNLYILHNKTIRIKYFRSFRKNISFGLIQSISRNISVSDILYSVSDVLYSFHPKTDFTDIE